MGKELWCGQTELNTSGNGIITKQVEEASFSTQMGIFMMATGKATKQADTEFTLIARALGMKGSG
jgi:hypothetical protein